MYLPVIHSLFNYEVESLPQLDCFVIESMQPSINRTNNMKSVGWMRPKSRNSVSVATAVSTAIISFKRKDVLVVAAIGIDDQVNTDSPCWSPASNSSNAAVSLHLFT